MPVTLSVIDSASRRTGFQPQPASDGKPPRSGEAVLGWIVWLCLLGCACCSPQLLADETEAKAAKPPLSEAASGLRGLDVADRPKITLAAARPAAAVAGSNPHRPQTPFRGQRGSRGRAVGSGNRSL